MNVLYLVKKQEVKKAKVKAAQMVQVRKNSCHLVKN